MKNQMNYLHEVVFVGVVVMIGVDVEVESSWVGIIGVL